MNSPMSATAPDACIGRVPSFICTLSRSVMAKLAFFHEDIATGIMVADGRVGSAPPP